VLHHLVGHRRESWCEPPSRREGELSPIALSQSVVSAPFDAFRAGEDLVRDPVQLVLQQLIEVEAAEVIGRGRYEGTESRVTERNGSRPSLGP
jgi:hypothetical protein